jgi:uncharacterized protein YlxP (DUF503 family)
MTVGLLTLELYLPLSQSLKDKRMVLRRVKDRVGAMNVSVAEVAHQDLWQRAGLGVVTIASSDEMAGKTLQSVLDEIERLEPGLVTRSQVEYLR